MPRSHGRILSAIWNDPDFIALPVDEQRLYLFLLSQPDLSHAGLVPLRARRWASKVANATASTIEATLTSLQQRRFVVTDLETEEVLIRTFVRNDGVYKQPKVMLRLREDARQIESSTLRAAFRAELDRLPLNELNDEPPTRGGLSTKAQVSAVVDTLRSDFADAPEYPSPGVSDTQPDTPRVRAGAFPQPPTPFPQPPTTVPPPAGRGEPGTQLALVGDAPTAQTLVAEWIDHCDRRPPGRIIGQISKELKTLLDEDFEPERIRAALAEWNRRGLHPSVLPSVVHEIGNRKPSQRRNDIDWDAAFARAAARDEMNGADR